MDVGISGIELRQRGVAEGEWGIQRIRDRVVG
jgi:hypothetical protein